MANCVTNWAFKLNSSQCKVNTHKMNCFHCIQMEADAASALMTIECDSVQFNCSSDTVASSRLHAFSGSWSPNSPTSLERTIKMSWSKRKARMVSNWLKDVLITAPLVGNLPFHSSRSNRPSCKGKKAKCRLSTMNARQLVSNSPFRPAALLGFSWSVGQSKTGTQSWSTTLVLHFQNNDSSGTCPSNESDS